MNDAVHVVQIRQSLEHRQGDEGDDIDVDGAYSLVDAVERALVHELYAHADIRVGQVRAVEGDDIV